MPARSAARASVKGNGSAVGPARIGVALAGGGPAGAVYEIGALRALEECLEGVDLNDLDIYVGVSAGAFIGACLANGITTSELCRSIVSEHPQRVLFDPARFFTPAWGELARRAKMVPGLLVDGLWDYLRRRDDFSPFEPLLRVARALPVGLFETHPIGELLHQLFTRPGRSDDFRELSRRLLVVAAELDTGRTVCFGGPGFEHVPISKAVEASAALPGLYAPVEIDGRYYVDGILRKTMHASLALEAGMDLLLAVNPIVPVDASAADASDAAGTAGRLGSKLVDRGLPAVLAQTLRTLIRSRMAVGMKTYETQFPHAQVLLIEPKRDDFRMFFTNIFSFSERKAVCEHAYQNTRAFLREHGAELAPKLALHGVRLRTEVLDEPDGSPWKERKKVGRKGRRLSGESDLAVVDRLDQALDRLDELLPAS